MEEIRYYYFRTMNNVPIITICIIHRGEEWARGIAICSKRDIPCKAIGRAIATGRARAALITQSSKAPVNRDEALLSFYAYWPGLSCEAGFVDKSKYMPELTSYEKKLLRIE